MSQPSHSEPEYLVSAEKTSNPETRITLNPKTTNLPEFGLRTAGCAESKSHQKKPTQRLPRLGRELVGAGPGLRLRRSRGFGGLGALGRKERQRTTKGQDYFETERWEQMSSRTPSLRHGGSDTKNEFSDNQRLGGQTSVSAAAERAK